VGLADALVVYCERQGPGLFAEPLNALSNLAFFYGAWRLRAIAVARTPRQALRIRWLSGLLALVGVGSAAFHTLATRWASILDVAFIGLFNLAYLAMFLADVVGWPRGRIVAALLGFVLLDRTVAAVLPEGFLNGSGMYLPALAVLLAITAHAWRLRPDAGRAMAAAATVFVVALGARTVDRAICTIWPWGTHFLWHLLNAWVLYRLAKVLSDQLMPAGSHSAAAPPTQGCAPPSMTARVDR
jgi:hypothetical protein